MIKEKDLLNSLKIIIESIKEDIESVENYLMHARESEKYIPFIKDGGYGYSPREKEKELTRLRKNVTQFLSFSFKMLFKMRKDIEKSFTLLIKNRDASCFNFYFNELTELKSKVDNLLFDARKYAKDFRKDEIYVEENSFSDEFKNKISEPNLFDLVKIGIVDNSYTNFWSESKKSFSYYRKKYGKCSPKEYKLIFEGYTGRNTSFSINGKLRNNIPLTKDENKIFLLYIMLVKQIISVKKCCYLDSLIKIF